ncbi:MAG: VWA domain-containing protein, partial [Planctomycetota bacterium]|nr:VWA domain-containing protein [Planctomycetota bacterium]
MEIAARNDRWFALLKRGVCRLMGGGARDPGVAFWISLCLHAAVLLAVANVSFESVYRTAVVTLFPTDTVRDSALLPTDFSSQVSPCDSIGGGDGLNGADLGAAPSVAELAAFPVETDQLRDSPFELEASNVSLAEAPRLDVDQLVRGVAAVGATGAEGAIDQITDELLQMLHDGPTLVVWILDRSASLAPQRALIVRRLQRIYEELGVIEASGHQAFQRHTTAPLVTAVMSFAEQPTWIIKQPTDDVTAIQSAIASIGDELDGTGIERTFTAIGEAATHFKLLRRPDRRTGLPQRNIALVVFSDEAADDAEGLDRTVQLCRKFSMPVYVVGVPAPFGRQFTPVKWIDPDPAYDQRPQWPTVRQGPETLLPEYVKLEF